MCDTLGILSFSNSLSIFAKNSDRQIQEPQILVYAPAQTHAKKRLKTTYIEIEQVPRTHAVLISKPSWTWGAEMGVNDCGVCIGNEATIRVTDGARADALTGLDLTRLGLERSSSALQALEVMISLLEKYGQGGNCGYVSPFCYDNSFIIMDYGSLFILETKGKEWAYKKVDKGNISNLYVLSSADAHSKGYAFTKPSPSASAKRRNEIVARHLGKIMSVEDAFKPLRAHSAVGSPCMHGAEYKTTSSMVVVLNPAAPPMVYFTGCSSPCVALFKPYVFGSKPKYPICTEAAQSTAYWQSQDNMLERLREK